MTATDLIFLIVPLANSSTLLQISGVVGGPIVISRIDAAVLFQPALITLSRTCLMNVKKLFGSQLNLVGNGMVIIMCSCYLYWFPTFSILFGLPRVGVREKLATTRGSTGPYIAANCWTATLTPGGAPFGGILVPTPGGGGGTNGATRLGATFIFMVFLSIGLIAIFVSAEVACELKVKFLKILN